jgi:hypothetical protein
VDGRSVAPDKYAAYRLHREGCGKSKVISSKFFTCAQDNNFSLGNAGDARVEGPPKWIVTFKAPDEY